MKNILLAVVGLSPQVITETLFALHQQGRRVDAIHVITTRHGKESINAHLLSPCDGRYQRYLRDYEIDGNLIDFGFDNVHAVKDRHGIDIDDIVSEDENELFLRCCLDWAFRLTRDPDVAVFFSLAGGRKTMSACLTIAAQFYARPQDRVYHVLITPEYESNRDFFYPPRTSTAIELKDRDGHPYFKETRWAEVNLVPLPFVSVRERLMDNMLKKPEEPATLLLSLVREDSMFLTIDLLSSRIAYGKREMDMMPARLALFAFFAMQKKMCPRQEAALCLRCHDCFLGVEEVLDRKEEIAELYRKLTGSRDYVAMSETGILGLDRENFNSYKGKIRHDLERGFGAYLLPEIAVNPIGRRPDTRYGLRIDKEKIRIII